MDIREALVIPPAAHGDSVGCHGNEEQQKIHIQSRSTFDIIRD